MGKGLEDGCDIECLRHYLKKLERNPKGAQWRGSIMTISTAGFWTRSRLADADIVEGDSAMCQRCEGGCIETPLHRNWQCPANAELEACAATADLVDAAVREADECPCFWHRGLVPAAWTKTSPPMEHEKSRATTC